jgi:hypothetical protein
LPFEIGQTLSILFRFILYGLPRRQTFKAIIYLSSEALSLSSTRVMVAAPSFIGAQSSLD